MKGRIDKAMFSVRLPRELRDGLRTAAHLNGITIEEYVTTVFAGRSFDTAAAHLAKPLADMSYHLSRVRAALNNADLDAARAELLQTLHVVTESLRSLRTEHDYDVAAAKRTNSGSWGRG